MIALSTSRAERTRYRMLETLRQYGDEALKDHADRDVWTARHARHVADLAADLEARLVRRAVADAWVAFGCGVGQHPSRVRSLVDGGGP